MFKGLSVSLSKKQEENIFILFCEMKRLKLIQPTSNEISNSIFTTTICCYYVLLTGYSSNKNCQTIIIKLAFFIIVLLQSYAFITISRPKIREMVSMIKRIPYDSV